MSVRDQRQAVQGQERPEESRTAGEGHQSVSGASGYRVDKVTAAVVSTLAVAVLTSATGYLWVRVDDLIERMTVGETYRVKLGDIRAVTIENRKRIRELERFRWMYEGGLKNGSADEEEGSAPSVSRAESRQAKHGL